MSLQIPTIKTPTIGTNQQSTNWQNTLAGLLNPNNTRTPEQTNALTKSLELNNQQLENYMGTMAYSASPYLSMANSAISGIGSLANIYVGFEQLDLAKKADARSAEAWTYQKEELDHLRAVRDKNNARVAQAEADPNSAYYRG